MPSGRWASSPGAGEVRAGPAGEYDGRAGKAPWVASASELDADINARLAAAERLLASSAWVSDAAEHRLWQMSRDLWVEGTIRALLPKLNVGFAGTFKSTVVPRTGEGTITKDLPVELEGVRQGIALLIALRTRTDRAAPDAPQGERRAPRIGP